MLVGHRLARRENPWVLNATTKSEGHDELLDELRKSRNLQLLLDIDGHKTTSVQRKQPVESNKDLKSASYRDSTHANNRQRD